MLIVLERKKKGPMRRGRLFSIIFGLVALSRPVVLAYAQMSEQVARERVYL
jgi:hypothetical protein